MSIVRKCGCVPALVVAVVLAGCGSDPGGNAGACDFDKVEKGCVGLLNFHVNPQQMEGMTVPARYPKNGGISPGVMTVRVTDTGLNSVHSFHAVVDGLSQLAVDCTVTSTAWVSTNPAVILQQQGVLTCGTW